jgi:UDP-glucose 4-epimerase
MVKYRENSSFAVKSSKILIMGGLGFIGSHLSRLLLAEGYSVRIFDKLYGSRNLIADIQGKVEIEEGDAERPEDILRSLQGIDIAIDLIHTTVPGTSMQDSAYDVQTNVAAHAGWLSQLHKTRLRRIIYVSSGGTVYGIPQKNPIGEDHPTEPISSYGITKLAIEKYIAMYANIEGIDYRICRPANVYGEGQHLHVGQGAIGVFLERCLKNQPIEIWGDGTVSRDYIYVADMVQAIVEVIAHQGVSRVFNISSGIGHSLNDIITIFRDDLQIPVKVNYVKSRKFDVPVNILDSSRLMRETGWKPQIDMADGLRIVYKYLKTSLQTIAGSDMP